MINKLYSIPVLAASLCLVFAQVIQASTMSAETVEGATTVETQQAFDLLKPGALFVDVRNGPAWEAGRIPGAVHLQLKKVFSEASLGEEAATDEAVVIYCNGPKCLRSAKACSKAVRSRMYRLPT